MAYRRGFKTEATSTADDIRTELGLGPLDTLDPVRLADYLDIPIWTLSSFQEEHPSVGHLLAVEPELFSAVTVFDRHERTIVHNDAHTPGRQNSNLAR